MTECSPSRGLSTSLASPGGADDLARILAEDGFERLGMVHKDPLKQAPAGKKTSRHIVDNSLPYNPRGEKSSWRVANRGRCV